MVRLHLFILCVIFSHSLSWGIEFSDVWTRVQIPDWASRIFLQMPIDAGGPTEKVFAPNCEFPVTNFKIKDSERALASFSGKLSDASYYVKDLLALLAENPEARPVAKAFLPLWESKTIEVLLVTKDSLANRSIAGAAAFCESVNGVKKIYLDKTEEIGLILPIFYHELIHCLDSHLDQENRALEGHLLKGLESAAKIVNSVASEKEKDGNNILPNELKVTHHLEIRKIKRKMQQFDQIRSYRTERRAYNAQYEISKWLLSRNDAYYRAKGQIPVSFLSPTSDDFIIENYGIHPQWFEKYKRGLCETTLQ